jgi:DNA invertase Pin-like site-specific DNA recombinase
MSLPRNPDDLRGLRAAIWIRESTPSQFDRYGPETQRRLIAGAVTRLGLINTGIAFSVARSGSTVYLHKTMREAIAAAQAGAYDVLVVAYVDRWQRNLRQTLNVLDDELHPAGAAVWFCDEEILSSCERNWDQLVDLAKAAESWLRRHRRRVKEGLAAKLASKRDPGGRPQYGFRRNEDKITEINPERIEIGKRAFTLALERLTDRQIAARLGLPLCTVRGILTSPLYVGRLRDGGPANWPPVIDVTTWNTVAQLRAARYRRSPGRPEIRRTYLLPMLECEACGRRLVGDKDRYRHINACEPFRAVAPQPERPTRGQHIRIPGQSYPRIDFESLVPLVLERVSLGAADIANTVSLYHSMRGPGPDQLAIARIEHERERAAATFVRERNMAALEEAMARLDEEERAAKVSVPAEPIPPAEIRRYLEHLPEWWAAVGPDDRKALAETLFAKIRVLGTRRAIIEPTFEAAARGLPEAFGIDEVEMVGARGVSPTLYG